MYVQITAKTGVYWMGFIQRFFSDKSLGRRIYNYLFVGIFIPFILISVIHSFLSTRELDKILMQNTEQMLSQMDMMLGFYMQTIENTMSITESTAFVKDFIAGRADQKALDDMREFLRVIQHRNSEIAGILIVNQYDETVSNEIHRVSRDPLNKEGWYKRAMADPEAYILISKPLGRNLTSNSNYGDDEIMSIVKAIKNPDSDGYGGVMLLDFRLSAFDENIRNITLGSEGFLYVTDTNGDIIYAPYNPVIYRIDNRYILNNTNPKTVVKIGGENYQIVCKKDSAWNIMGVFLVRDVMSTVNQLRYITILIFICTIVLVQFFSARLNSMLFTPLGELQKLMKLAENGNIDVQFPVATEDEIGALGHSFNRMISEIRKLLTIIEEENKLKREAEIQVLQEQIKPHFLYNTLDTINWIAMECGAQEIVRLVTALTKLFRLSLNKGNEFTTLENEIEQVKNYLIIQAIRYEEAFDYVFETDPDALPLSVLKLILQPLVENSIYHGVKERAVNESGYTGRIVVSAKRAGDMLILSVKDDGAGMPPEKAEELNRMFISGKQTVGYGLFNVNQRLKYTFGPKYGLLLKSGISHGTEVVVFHPAMEESTYEAIDR